MEKFKSALFGFIVGDILGIPVEFQSREELRENPLTGLRAFGTHNQPLGSFSDDTSMTLCTVESIINNLDLAQTMDLFRKWHDEHYMTSHGLTFDSGITTSEAIDNFKDGLPIDKCGLSTFENNGNGSLMRMLPVAFMNLNKSFQERYQNVFKYSSLTHRNNLSILCCFYYTELIKLILEGYSLIGAYKSLQINFETDLINNKLNTTHIEQLDRVLKSDISNINEQEIESTGFVIHSLEASIWSLLTTNSYKSAVLKSINLGEDTDTIGAVTGSIAGMIYGLNSIPQDWLKSIPQKKIIDKLISDFVLKTVQII